jgi:hypothetical protein
MMLKYNLNQFVRFLEENNVTFIFGSQKPMGLGFGTYYDRYRLFWPDKEGMIVHYVDIRGFLRCMAIVESLRRDSIDVGFVEWRK